MFMQGIDERFRHRGNDLRIIRIGTDANDRVVGIGVDVNDRRKIGVDAKILQFIAKNGGISGDIFCGACGTKSHVSRHEGAEADAAHIAAFLVRTDKKRNGIVFVIGCFEIFDQLQ